MKESLERPLKLYLDTSVLNFVFAEDAPHEQEITQKLFSQVATQKLYQFYVSAIVIREVEKAPPAKREKLMSLMEDIELLVVTEAVEPLARDYLKSGAIPLGAIEDARHVAVATIHNLDAVVSWNFKHLVNLRRIKLVNLVNEATGYKHIEIISPREVIGS